MVRRKGLEPSPSPSQGDVQNPTTPPAQIGEKEEGESGEREEEEKKEESCRPRPHPLTLPILPTRPLPLPRIIGEASWEEGMGAGEGRLAL